MPDNSARLSLPYLMPSQAQKHVTHNAALERLDMLVQPQVLDLAATTPPAAPEEGATYVLGTGAGGAWAGQDGMLASWSAGAWIHLTPQEGWQVLLLPETRLYALTGGTWQPVAGATQNLDGIGINAASDGTNRLAVSSDATLLSHDGSGHQLKVNKATAADTASLLFQSGFSGRAEMGLAGSDHWSLKVSADGTAWTEALVVAPGSGHVGIGVAAPACALDVAGAIRPGAYASLSRPAAASVGAGAGIYDTTLALPLWSDGTDWRDAAGAIR
jgi:hypothetical protein